jgi:hypothetical protein
MVRPYISDGEGFHVRIFAAYMFDNQSQMAERGRFASGGIEKATKLLTVNFRHATVSVQRI